MLKCFFLLACLGGAVSAAWPQYDFGEAWVASRKKYKKVLREFKQKIDDQDKAGKNVWCLQQKYIELQWLVQATDRQADIDRLFKEMEQEKPAEAAKDSQDPKDGSWGRCYREWFFKLDTSVDQIRGLAIAGKVPQYPPKFLDRINSPVALRTYLDSLLISDPRRNRINHRKELNYAVPGLLRLIQKKRPANYAYAPGLREVLLEFIRRWQNPETGWWGAWYQQGNTLIKTDDLSITFHLASYLEGQVDRKGTIVRTLLKLRPEPYPFGLMEDGKYTTHHNYDAVRLMRYGWGELTDPEKAEARVEIEKMLNHCLTQALQLDGSFAVSPADDSVGDAFYFGVSFLDEVGFFDRRKRFWTSKEFPEAEKIRLRILASAQKITNPNLMLKDALEKLNFPPAPAGAGNA